MLGSVNAPLPRKQNFYNPRKFWLNLSLYHVHANEFHYFADKFKPSIAHRDFNTRNILVKADLRCCVCDLGFAMKIQGSKFFRNGQEENAEQSSLTDVSNC